VVALVSAGLVACGDDSDGDGLVGDASEAGSEDTVGAYVHPSGCISFDPAEEWEQVDETGLGVEFSADPGNPLGDQGYPGAGPAPGEPGVLVAADCAPLDQVGSSGPVPIPGYELVDDTTVDFGGGEGRLVEYLIERAGSPAHVNLQVTVDMNDARCTLTVIGARDAVEPIRDDFDAAVESYRCSGR
jgi:hypothetical protein